MIPFEASIWAFIAVTAAEKIKMTKLERNKTAEDLPSTEGSKRFATVNRRSVRGRHISTVLQLTFVSADKQKAKSVSIKYGN